jgi:hypothetical protein
VASKGYVEAILNSLPADERKALALAFGHVLDDWQLGTGQKAQNARWYRYDATTSATPDEEFSIVHGLGRPPATLIPVLDIGVVNAKTVRLQVTRAADSQRVYLSSPEVSAAITVYLE